MNAHYSTETLQSALTTTRARLAGQGDFLILRAVRESGGFAIAVEDEDTLAAQADAARLDGMLLGPEGAATLAAYRQCISDGRIDRDASVVLFNCGTPLKYDMPPVRRRIDLNEPLNFAALAAQG